MDSRKFEDSWKEAFEGAEMQPSDGVWTNIELDLEKAEGGKIKRRLLLYKLLTAASMTFALGLAGVYYMKVQNQPPNNLADAAGTKSLEVRPSMPGTPADDSLETGAGNGESAGTDIRGIAGQALADANPAGSSEGPGTKLSPSAAGTSFPAAEELTSKEWLADRTPSTDGEVAILNEPQQADGVPDHTAVQRTLPALYVLREPTLNLDRSEPDAGALLLARLAQEELVYAEEDKRAEKQKSERLWTSVGVAAGAFSAVNAGVTQTPTTAFAANNSSVPDKQAKASGYAYSFGVNIGTKLSNRWVLMGGVNYLTQSSDYTATNVVADNNFKTLKAESINQLDMIQSSGGSSRLAPTFPYNVNNNVQFFSVPVQAGYLVVNNRFSVQLNAGVSTDLFLQNTITPEGVSLDKVTQGSGADSPYRPVNFSGLMGTELSYRFGQRYRLAINPGLRYPFSSVYKSDVGVQSNPLTFDVGLRFRYIFH